ncbi:MAG: BatA domain-containing protein [Isosphaerales bacterium]
MSFSLINAGLAAGAALAALPVILHLFMRQTPKHVIFPALRLIRERQRQSKKRLRVKNWLLLLARMAILALMALALARPRLYSQVPLGDESVPTALGLVFDTSLSMEYKEKDKTRLDEAKRRAREIVSKLPDSSLVFIVDSAETGSPIGLPPSAALKRIDGLTIRRVNRPLNPAMGQVYAAVADCDRPTHVVYVLTDRARSAWHVDRPAEGLDLVAKLNSSKGSKLLTFILSLAPHEIQNVGIDSAEPESSVATQGQPVEIRARLRNEGPHASTRLVEFELDGIKRDEKSVVIPPNAQQEVTFVTPPRLREGELHQGKIKLRGTPDPFEIDDERYFTFKVRPPLKVLVVSDQTYDAEHVAAALDPDPTSSTARPYQVEKIHAADLGRKFIGDLQAYSCIFVLNVKQLDDPDWWGVLNHYVHEGGGLVVAPGNRSLPASYNNVIAVQFLPAQLAERPKRPPGRITLGKIGNITHPLFQRYGQDLDGMLAQVPVYIYWPIKQPVEGTRTLLKFSDGEPALVERSFKGKKTGRVLLWTTPLSRRPDSGGDMRSDPGAWSEFPFPAYGWSFLALMDQTVPYLAGTSKELLNFDAGESVLLKLDPTFHFTSFLVTGPSPATKPRLLPSPSSEFLEIGAPPDLGPWTVKAKAVDNREKMMGFSVNVPRGESQFAPLEKNDLDSIFGKDGYLLAEDAAAHTKMDKIVRFGYEVFPWLMFLILMVVTLENFLANTFYKEPARAKTAGAVS